MPISRPWTSPGLDTATALTCPRASPLWRLAPSGGPFGVRTTTSLFAQVLGRRTEAVYAVTEYDPGRTVTWKTVRGPLPLTFWRRVDPEGDGTRATMGYAGDFRGLLGFLRLLIVPIGKRALRGDLPTLKRLLESSAS